MVKRILKVCISLIGILALGLISFLGYMSIVDYKPCPKEKILLDTYNQQETILKKHIPFSILTWNIGYCGLDKDQDFFKSGGKGSGSESLKRTYKNLENITAYLIEQQPTIAFLQEVDMNATRSFHVNQMSHLRKLLSNYSNTFATNYKVKFIPVPIKKPLGSVDSGIATFSQLKSYESSRHQYPGKEKWPIQLFMLDRCFLEQRMPIVGDKELILIQTHLSAYDKGGMIRKKQLKYLKQYILKEYHRGNYVIVGGDFNHVLPHTDPEKFKHTESWPAWLMNLPKDFTPNQFKWVVDPNIPTVRNDRTPYREGKTFTAVIDGFLVSPNVEAKMVYTKNFNFEYTDHQPVIGIFSLK